MGELSQEQINHERQLAAYNQNSQNFRSLNQLMWQIPLLGMSLTGGLWFGVSKVGSSVPFQVFLLLLAVAGNIGLIIILQRLRYIMSQYLNWIEAFDASGFVSAKGGVGFEKSYVVKRTFQILLFLAALFSIILLIIVVCTCRK